MSRRARGFETEELVVAALRADGWPQAETPTRGAGGRDILGTPGVCFEIKARTGFEPLAAMRQAARNADGDLPVVLLRLNGQGEKSIDSWPAILPFGELRKLLRAAGFGEPFHGPVEAETTTFGDLARGVRVWLGPDGARREESVDG